LASPSKKDFGWEEEEEEEEEEDEKRIRIRIKINHCGGNEVHLKSKF
jgi:hypothetical protein